ncbi:hypothetical protein GE09DRAFT_1231722 [Coniochaeta sp. 2T2.1]|nr:hypothetical protein GE09DRAFT_1231722 [Coniochaeta sp. 2T2.1]
MRWLVSNKDPSQSQQLAWFHGGNIVVITRLPTGEGLAAGGGPRDTVSAAPAYDFDSSGLDSSFANMTASYADDDPTPWEIYDPEYAVAPWARNGHGKL